MKKKKTINKYLRTLLAYALSSASLFQMALPVFAQTAAGTPINNTATATYEDRNDPTQTYETESNTVTIRVAKVAGITNVPSGFNNLGDLTSAPPGAGAGGNVLTGHTVEFFFDVTNTGNDVTDIFIPDLTNINTTGLDRTDLGNTLQIEIDDGSGFQARPGNGIIANVAVGATIQVKVTGIVTATSAGAPISVQLGNTGSNGAPNAPADDTQNIDDTLDGVGSAQTSDVRTENATNPTVPGDPANGQREASAVNQVFLGSNPKALAIIRKTNAGVNDNGTTDLNDDVITYDLSLEVANSSPNPLFTPGALDGRDYTDTPTTTPADEAQWNTVTTELGPITRIGWVYDVNVNGLINPGDTVSGFTFTVTTSGLNSSTGGTVANIAQVFGTTDPDGVDDDTSEGSDVFDESGDSNPANLNDNGSVGPDEDDPESDGVGDPANHGTDASNNNTGSGPGGEDNVISISPPGTILNGPDGQAGASGNIFGEGPDNNHDFQNKAIAPVTVDATSDPGAVTFTNTLSNPGSTPLEDILLQPIQPSALGGNNTDLPNGTVVTFNSQTATYTYDQTNERFNITAGTPILIPSLSANVSVDYTVDVNLPTVGNSTDEADSNSSDFNGVLRGGFPVPIVAYQDGDGDGTPLDGSNQPEETIANYTVNQIYKGFLKLIKQLRVLESDGTNVAQDWTISPSPAQPGQILEYRIIYRNISEPQAGSGTNVVLDANNIILTEDGESAGPDYTNNNWADDSNSDGNMDTVNVQNSATDTSSGSTINYFITGEVNNGTIDTGTNVTGYQVSILTLPPAGIEDISDFLTVDSGDETFTFQRQINDAFFISP